MAQKNRSWFKALFITGYKPNQSDYADLVDSFVSKADDSPVVFHQFTTGALSAGAVKTVSHDQGLGDYSIIVRNATNDNNAMVSLLQKNGTDPTNKIDIKSSIDIAEPGLTIQIIGK